MNYDDIQALEADALHFSTDIWSSSVVLLGLVCAHFGLYYADPIAALFVALIVFFISYKLGKRSMDVLLDKAPRETKAKIEKILKSFPEIIVYHNLKDRTAGADTFVEVNINLLPDLTLQETHTICDRVEEEIRKNIDRCEVFVHPEPA